MGDFELPGGCDSISEGQWKLVKPYALLPACKIGSGRGQWSARRGSPAMTQCRVRNTFTGILR